MTLKIPHQPSELSQNLAKLRIWISGATHSTPSWTYPRGRLIIQRLQPSLSHAVSMKYPFTHKGACILAQQCILHDSACLKRSVKCPEELPQIPIFRWCTQDPSSFELQASLPGLQLSLLSLWSCSQRRTITKAVGWTKMKLATRLSCNRAVPKSVFHAAFCIDKN